MYADLIGLFKEYNALLEGHFILSSGLHSNKYLQCALLLQHPELAEELCKKIAALFQKEKPTVVIGPALGGVIVAHETARALGVRALFTERQSEQMTLRRGFKVTEEDRVLVVEDVITTGGSAAEVIKVIQPFGAKIIGVGAIIDRSGGKADFGGIDLRTLLCLDVQTYEPQTCPLCKKGIPAEKPGSKKR